MNIMATKTWKLGEVCKGGVVTAEIKGKTVSIIGKEWDTTQGFSKASNQSNAKEFTRKTLNADSKNARWQLDLFLSDLTTSYWTDEILKWVETKVKLNNDW